MATSSICFINEETELIAVGGENKVEIWSVASKESLKVVKTEPGFINAVNSTKNILAIGTSDGYLQLFDVRTWDSFFSQKFGGMYTRSLHLTSDLKFLTIGSHQGDKCIVLDIQ